HFINPRGGPDVMAAYREHFRHSAELAAPLGNVGISVICADTNREAEELAACLQLWRLKNERGMPGPVPTREEAATYPYTQVDRAHMDANRGRVIAGDPAVARRRPPELAEAYA